MKMVGIILAGGRTSSMGDLTKRRADAALPIGACYRAIDFSLTNMVSSGIENVAVVAQSASGSLNDHLSQAQWWGFGRKRGGLHLINPTITPEHQEWYRGTADSIWQNLRTLEKFNEPYAVVASGDGIYKLNYEKVLEQHERTGADVTVVCVKQYPGAILSRYGLVDVAEDGRVLRLKEKSENETEGLISCGIYLLRREALMKLVTESVEAGKYSFVKDVLVPIVENRKVYAYVHDGYWKNVAYKDNYYEANMDLLKPDVRRELLETEPLVLTRPGDEPPARYGEKSSLKNSLVGNGAVVNGEVCCSVLFDNVTVGEGSRIVDSLLLPGVKVGKNCVLENCIINSRTEIPDGTVMKDYGRE